MLKKKNLKNRKGDTMKKPTRKEIAQKQAEIIDRTEAQAQEELKQIIFKNIIIRRLLAYNYTEDYLRQLLEDITNKNIEAQTKKVKKDNAKTKTKQKAIK